MLDATFEETQPLYVDWKDSRVGGRRWVKQWGATKEDRKIVEHRLWGIWSAKPMIWHPPRMRPLLCAANLRIAYWFKRAFFTLILTSTVTSLQTHYPQMYKVDTIIWCTILLPHVHIMLCICMASWSPLEMCWSKVSSFILLILTETITFDKQQWMEYCDPCFCSPYSITFHDRNDVTWG